MRFSQRMGYKPAKSIVQLDSVDDDLFNGLWNVFHSMLVPDAPVYDEDGMFGRLVTALWTDHFKLRVDLLSHRTGQVASDIYSQVKSGPWYEVYDFIEFVASNAPGIYQREFIDDCNEVLERELSGFRFVAGQLAPITSEEELATIDEALKSSTALGGVNVHLRAALAKLSDRKNPDFRNSIKEAISAVEALVTLVSGTPKVDLPKGLAALEQAGALHKALKSSYLSLYSYTNDANGIRHALMDEPSISFTDAKFMYIACVAFVNYVVGKCAELGIPLGKTSSDGANK